MWISSRGSKADRLITPLLIESSRLNAPSTQISDLLLSMISIKYLLLSALLVIVLNQRGGGGMRGGWSGSSRGTYIGTSQLNMCRSRCLRLYRLNPTLLNPCLKECGSFKIGYFLGAVGIWIFSGCTLCLCSYIIDHDSDAPSHN